MSTHILKVGEDDRDLRLDVFLTKNLSDVPSRTYVQKLIEEELVSVNNHRAKANYKVNAGDEISVDLPVETFSGDLEPQDIPLDILFEDDDILVLNKPAGLCVHPGAGQDKGTLANALAYHFRQLSDVGGSLRPGIVHRLDQDTSGVMIIAKNNSAHADLGRQFEQRLVEKCYVALVKGIVEFDEGIIDAPIGRHPLQREKQAVYNFEGRDAETIYKVMQRFKRTTLVGLYPKTGRTHQLRVHMAHLGHPVMGDSKYGRDNPFKRLALHARSIRFTHPRTGETLSFETPIPEDFVDGHY